MYTCNKRWFMATRCELTGKGNGYYDSISHAKNRTHRVRRANIQKKTFIVEGQKITMNLSTQAIRTLRKKGIL